MASNSTPTAIVGADLMAALEAAMVSDDYHAAGVLAKSSSPHAKGAALAAACDGGRTDLVLMLLTFGTIDADYVDAAGNTVGRSKPPPTLSLSPASLTLSLSPSHGTRCSPCLPG